MKKDRTKCLNCGNLVKGNYCNHCGQSVKTGRIDSITLIEELQHNFIHIHKGLLFTLKELFIRPKKSINQYLDGKRIKYISPIQYLFILGAFYSLLIHFFEVYPDSEVHNLQTTNTDFSFIYHYYYNYYSLWLLFLIPLSALSSFLFYKKSEHNYIEHLVINSYIVGNKIFIMIIFYPIFYFTHSHIIYDLVHIISLAYNVVILAYIFKTTSWILATLKAISSIIFVLFIVSILILLF